MQPRKNPLPPSLGGPEYCLPSQGMASVTPDSGFLLCTDGFWERTAPEEMAALVFSPRKNERGHFLRGGALPKAIRAEQKTGIGSNRGHALGREAVFRAAQGRGQRVFAWLHAPFILFSR